MVPTSLKAIMAAALISGGILPLSSSANAGWGCGWGCGWGPAIAGFGVGAMIGSALAGPPIYVGPPPPPFYFGPEVYGPPDYDGPVAYGPPPRMENWDSHRVHSGSKTPSDTAARGLRPGSSTTAKTGALTGAVKQEADAKFKAAQAKAKLSDVGALTQKDIEGLSREQIKQLRGY